MGLQKPRSSSVLGVTAVAMRTRRGGSHGIRAPTFYFHGVPVISQNPPELWGLYSRLCPSRMKFPQRFPCFCSVPGFRASTAVPTFPRRSPFFAVSPDSGPLQRFPLFHGAPHGVAVSPDSGPLRSRGRRLSRPLNTSPPGAFSCFCGFWARAAASPSRVLAHQNHVASLK